MTTVSLLLALLAAAPGRRDVPPVPLDGLEPAVARQLDEVRQRLDAGLRARKADAALFGEAARHYHAYGLVAAAEACYRNAEALAPADARWPYLLGSLLLDDSRIDEAASALERSLGHGELYYPALVRLAGVYLTLGRLDDAAATLEPARRHAPDDPALLSVSGQLALAQGRAQQAAADLQRALELEPRATRLHYPLGQAYRKLGRLDDARAELARAGGAGVRPRDPLLEGVLELRRGERSYMSDGQLAFRAGDFAGAAAAYRRAFDLSGGTSAGALVNLAAVEVRLGRMEEGLSHLQQAHALAPEDAVVLYNLGVLLAHAGRPADAEPLLARLVKLAPADDEARVAWGLALLALERGDEGLAALEPVVRVGPESCGELRERLSGLGERARALRARLEAGPCRP